MKKKIFSVALAGVLAGAMFAGCGNSASSSSASAASESKSASSNASSASSTSSASSESSATSEASASDAEGKSYSIAINTFGAGAYPLDEIMMHDERLAELIGCTTDKVDNQFTADVVVSQLQNQLTNNPDIVIPELMAATTFSPVVEKCIEAGVVFAFDSNFPDDDVQAKCDEYENFAGGVCSNPYDMGVQMAEIAYEDGCRSTMILAAAVGDYSHDNRIQGYTDKFEELGGKVVFVQHCSDPSEAVTKATDLFTGYADQVDSCYCSGGDYLVGAASVKTANSSYSEIKLYGTDINPDTFDQIADGTITANNGGQGVSGSLAMVLAVNLADGHKIVDDEGKAAMFNNLQVFVITKDNVEAFRELYSDGTELITDEEYKSLLYRYNPDVTFDDFNEFLENYGDNICERIGA